MIFNSYIKSSLFYCERLGFTTVGELQGAAVQGSSRPPGDAITLRCRGLHCHGNKQFAARHETVQELEVGNSCLVAIEPITAASGVDSSPPG
jgi:hypothetical protein